MLMNKSILSSSIGRELCRRLQSLSPEEPSSIDLLQNYPQWFPCIAAAVFGTLHSMATSGLHILGAIVTACMCTGSASLSHMCKLTAHRVHQLRLSR
ncbi:hypothetical protein N7520_000858 [Penicillium odoratum]|uniref:uncharacterized protein n=1 Tax=Penicillium odoratum TaxID=1167516 RepID=UPI0025493990|nr:uncharacterized protein N7520_000858 [Penicillium odoratum]KAJ5777612.1 hypothetical protein N7520_000858 [Penicillium odoratum]